MLLPTTILTNASQGGVLLYDNTLGGSTQTIDTNPTDLTGYTHLSIWTMLRTDNANNDVAIRFNNDSGANYDYENALFANVGSVTQGAGATSATITYCALSTSPADEYGTSQLWLPFYSGTKTKHVFSQGHARLAASANNIYSLIGGASWRSTAAITRIQIIANSNFVAGSQVQVTGWRV